MPGTPDRGPRLDGHGRRQCLFPRGGHDFSGTGIRVFGGGRDIYEGRDEFHFVSRECAGDFDIRASVTAPAATRILMLKAGFMFRASLDPRGRRWQ